MRTHILEKNKDSIVNPWFLNPFLREDGINIQFSKLRTTCGYIASFGCMYRHMFADGCVKRIVSKRLWISNDYFEVRKLNRNFPHPNHLTFTLFFKEMIIGTLGFLNWECPKTRNYLFDNLIAYHTRLLPHTYNHDNTSFTLRSMLNYVRYKYDDQMHEGSAWSKKMPIPRSQNANLAELARHTLDCE